MIDFCRESLETRLRTVVTQVKYVRLGESSVISLPVVLHHIALTKLSHEILVMGDDYELKVCVISALIDDTVRRMVSATSSEQMPRCDGHSLNKTGGKGVDILRVQSVGGFVQCQDTAVLPEGVCEREADDNRRQHLLTGRAASTHVHLHLVLRHDHLHGDMKINPSGTAILQT